jgi:hypothetical protein
MHLVMNEWFLNNDKDLKTKVNICFQNNQTQSLEFTFPA